MPNPRGHRRDQGFIIVAVLWILAALATLTLIYSLYVREAALNFAGHDARHGPMRIRMLRCHGRI